MKARKKNRLLFLICFILLATFFIVFSNGAASVGKTAFWQALVDFDGSEQNHQIIRNIRLPRITGAFLVGSCFTLSDVLMQSVTRNPLADSGLLGINAGASLAMVLSFAFWPKVPGFFVFLVSLTGLFAVTLLVFGFLQSSKTGMNLSQLTLAGVVISSFLTTISQAFIQFSNLQQDPASWLVDGAVNITWKQLTVLLPVYVLAVLVSFSSERAIPLTSSSEIYALALGGRPKRTRLIVFCLVAVLAAIVVSLVGLISFIGLLVPPIARGMAGTDYRYVLPVSFLVGDELVMLADLVARMINPSFGTPFGLVTVLTGVPFLLIQVRRE